MPSGEEKIRGLGTHTVFGKTETEKVPSWAGGMVQSVKRLPCKHEELSLISRYPHKIKLGVGEYACNPSMGRWRQVDPGVCGYSSQLLW